MPKLAKIITKIPNQVVWCVAMELVNKWGCCENSRDHGGNFIKM
jgi:hypothetical protein